MTRVTLSFDNGPHPDVTPRILDLLAAHDAKAHFFVLGKLVATPEGKRLVERARDEGHLVGNHSYTHATPLGHDVRPNVVQLEIAATEALLEPIVPGRRVFRPFGGGGVLGPHLLRRDAVRYLEANGYDCVLWNSVPRDWEDVDGWCARALDDCPSRAHTVLVLHDIPDACLAGLPRFLEQARTRGLELTLGLPDDCVPIQKGRVTGDLRNLVARESS